MKISAFVLAAAIGLMSLPAFAHREGGSELEFSHPLVAESPSPDTKIRMDYIWRRTPGGEDGGKADLSTVQVTAEYAFDDALGVEINVPYTWRAANGVGEESTDHTDDIEVALKYASDIFASHGVLFGGGLELGLPAGDSSKHIGSDHEVEIAPFVDFGWKRGDMQLVGGMSFGFPQNTDEAGFALGWNLALAYAATGHLNALLEVDSERVYHGEEDGYNNVNLTPGVTYALPGRENIIMGAGISFPVTEDKEFYVQPMASVFYHF